MAYSNGGSEPLSYIVVMVDCAGRLVIEVFYGSDQVGMDIMQPHGCPQSCLLNSVERLLKVHEDMTKILLVLWVFLTKYFKIENLLSCAPPCSEACLFFFDDFLRYGSFGIVVGYFSETESKVLTTLLSARSYCR